MNTTLIPVRYNTNRNVATQRLVENNIIVNLENKDDIKSNIDHYLFNEFYTYVLVKFNNTMYICVNVELGNIIFVSLEETSKFLELQLLI